MNNKIKTTTLSLVSGFYFYNVVRSIYSSLCMNEGLFGGVLCNICCDNDEYILGIVNSEHISRLYAPLNSSYLYIYNILSTHCTFGAGIVRQLCYIHLPLCIYAYAPPHSPHFTKTFRLDPVNPRLCK